jgi:ABC-2 type transport system permease protein
MVQPLLPTTPLALGEVDLQPIGYLASVDRWQGQARAEPSSPLWQRLPRFDVFFVIAYLLPLAIFVTCAGAIASERESGTLPLCRAQGATVAALGFGRVALRAGLLLTLTLAVVASCAVMDGRVTAASLPYLAIWMAGCVAYAAVWVALVLWVDSWRQSTGVNLLVCAGAWLLLLLVAPARFGSRRTGRVPAAPVGFESRARSLPGDGSTLTNTRC